MMDIKYECKYLNNGNWDTVRFYGVFQYSRTTSSGMVAYPIAVIESEYGVHQVEPRHIKEIKEVQE